MVTFQALFRANELRFDVQIIMKVAFFSDYYEGGLFLMELRGVRVASNGSRFVHASNVFIARSLYCRIVISGRYDISWWTEPPKNWTKMGTVSTP